MFNSPFDPNSKVEVSIPPTAQVIFVSDLFSRDHVGGAELTSDAIIDSSPAEVFRLHAKNLTSDLILENSEKYWIFGNFTSMNLELIPSIVSGLKYSVIEYDYKYCKYRSPEKHFASENSYCDCHEQMNGKMISAFYFGATSLWWMSERQREIYHSMFPFLARVENNVLSSVFDDKFFNHISNLVSENGKIEKTSHLVVGSDSWIKGVENSIKYCEENNLEYEVVKNLDYPDLLEKLSKSKCLVFLPNGADTCPRLVIEAKLLGCDLILNENVQHSREEWFNSDLKTLFTYLHSSRDRFWSSISKSINSTPTVSGYTTTYNCIDQKYPFEASIKSMLGFCNQVIVVDGGSTDGTWEALQILSNDNDKLIIHKQERDWNHKRFAVFDGLQKALARAMCTGEFCWQQDSDEIVHEDDFEKIYNLMKALPKASDLIALPVVEYWGSNKKVRVDVNPWKWRLSRNRPHITHGIPGQLRRFDSDGLLYSHPGTDGCDYIRSDSMESIPFSTFYTQDIHKVRSSALEGSQDALNEYELWMGNALEKLPSVYHYSWYDIERKINTYKNYWSKHWQSLYDIKQDDTSENNMFFNKPWSKVTDTQVKKLAKKLESKMGGWIFHEKVDFSKPTPHIKISKDHPSFIKEWLKK